MEELFFFQMPDLLRLIRLARCAEMAAIELMYAPQGAEMVSGMIYAPDEQGVNMLSAVIPRVRAL